MAQAMAQNNSISDYVRGHTERFLTEHLDGELNAILAGSAASDAAFILPYIKPTDTVLDLGCGQGYITAVLSKRASAGVTIGLDISEEVLQKAKANVPTGVWFSRGDVRDRLACEDNQIDVVFASRLFCLLDDGEAQRALAEVKRVLKPGGILATRDQADEHFYPASFGLDMLWYHNSELVFGYGKQKIRSPCSRMPFLFRSAGFTDSTVGARNTVLSTQDEKRFKACKSIAALERNADFRTKWIALGLDEGMRGHTISLLDNWAKTEAAWHVTLNCEMIGRK
jgi:SAM-dependent methyltransferase